MDGYFSSTDYMILEECPSSDLNATKDHKLLEILGREENDDYCSRLEENELTGKGKVADPLQTNFYTPYTCIYTDKRIISFKRSNPIIPKYPLNKNRVATDGGLANRGALLFRKIARCLHTKCSYLRHIENVENRSIDRASDDRRQIGHRGIPEEDRRSGAYVDGLEKSPSFRRSVRYEYKLDGMVIETKELRLGDRRNIMIAPFLFLHK
ncbi:hypothetical protein Trydic_g18644 [Trypoxylus dichotomus]